LLRTGSQISRAAGNNLLMGGSSSSVAHLEVKPSLKLALDIDAYGPFETLKGSSMLKAAVEIKFADSQGIAENRGKR